MAAERGKSERLQDMPFDELTVIQPRDDGRTQIEQVAPLEGFDGWRVRVMFLTDADVRSAFPTSLTIEHVNAATPPEPITTAMLRAVRLRSLQRTAEQRLVLSAPPELQPLTNALRANRPGPPTRWTDLRLAKLARQYVTLTESSSHALRALANQRHISYAAARSAVELARRRGMLTPTIRGRAGGQLTPKALDTLRKEDT
jgi:hypothetical protein